MFVGCQDAWLRKLVCRLACPWSNLGKDKTLGMCDGAAKWRLRTGVSAVVAGGGRTVLVSRLDPGRY